MSEPIHGHFYQCIFNVGNNGVGTVTCGHNDLLSDKIFNARFSGMWTQ